MSSSDVFAIIFVNALGLLLFGFIAKGRGWFRKIVTGIVKTYHQEGRIDKALDVINEALMFGLIDLDEAHQLTVELGQR